MTALVWIASPALAMTELAACPAYPPLEGEGRLTLSATKCETGWGDLSTRAPLGMERPSPHPAAPFSRVDPPPPGEGKEVFTSPRLRGEVGLRRRRAASSGAIRVRGTLGKLTLAESPPHPETSLPLRLRPLPASGARLDRRHSSQTQLRDLAARFARVLACSFRPLQSEGAGNAGRSARPQPRVQW